MLSCGAGEVGEGEVAAVEREGNLNLGLVGVAGDGGGARHGEDDAIERCGERKLGDEVDGVESRSALWWGGGAVENG